MYQIVQIPDTTLPGIQTTTFWHAVTSMQYTWENLTHRIGTYVDGWNCVSCTSLPVSIFHMNTFCVLFAEPDTTYFESGVKSRERRGQLAPSGIQLWPLSSSSCWSCYDGGIVGIDCGLKFADNLDVIVPRFASSSIIRFYWVPNKMYFPFGENFIYLISLVSLSIVNV